MHTQLDDQMRLTLLADMMLIRAFEDRITKLAHEQGGSLRGRTRGQTTMRRTVATSAQQRWCDGAGF